MASKYAGTKTEQNLKDAFSGESQARNKYTYYASAAKKAGYEQMSALYLETADQEKEHAKMWFKELHGIGTPEENLVDAAAGENYGENNTSLVHFVRFLQALYKSSVDRCSSTSMHTTKSYFSSNGSAIEATLQ